MRVLVLVKRVPDSRSAITLRADGSGVETGGVKFVCDPFDEFGVAQAVRLRETRGDVTEIVAITAGDASGAEVLRHALAMGADRAIHVARDSMPVHDELALARMLSAAIKRFGAFDLLLCGKQNIDNDAGELGPALAECMDLPHVGAVTKLELAPDGRSLTAHRRIEGAEEIVRSPLPALVTCEKGLIEPKIPPLPKVMKAKKEPIELIDARELMEQAKVRVGAAPLLRPPPGRPACQFIEGDPAEKARELIRRLRMEAKVIS